MKIKQEVRDYLSLRLDNFRQALAAAIEVKLCAFSADGEKCTAGDIRCCVDEVIDDAIKKLREPSEDPR